MVCGRLLMLGLMAWPLADDGAVLEQAASSLEPKAWPRQVRHRSGTGAGGYGIGSSPAV